MTPQANYIDFYSVIKTSRLIFVLLNMSILYLHQGSFLLAFSFSRKGGLIRRKRSISHIPARNRYYSQNSIHKREFIHELFTKVALGNPPTRIRHLAQWQLRLQQSCRDKEGSSVVLGTRRNESLCIRFILMYFYFLRPLDFFLPVA